MGYIALSYQYTLSTLVYTVHNHGLVVPVACGSACVGYVIQKQYSHTVTNMPKMNKREYHYLSSINTELCHGEQHQLHEFSIL